MGTESTTNWRDVSTSDHFAVPRAEPMGTSRRSFLRTAGIVGLGAAGLIGGASRPVDALPLGRDKTFTTLNRASDNIRYIQGSGRGGTETAITWPTINRMNAGVESNGIFLSGSENTLAQAQLGRHFKIDGSGSQPATITVTGRHGGDLHVDAHQLGTAQVDLRMFVRDLTAKKTKQSSIFTRKFSSPGPRRRSFALRDYSRSISTSLIGGHLYAVDVRVQSRVKSSPVKYNSFIAAWWHPGGRVSSGDDGGVYLDEVAINYQ